MTTECAKISSFSNGLNVHQFDLEINPRFNQEWNDVKGVSICTYYVEIAISAR